MLGVDPCIGILGGLNEDLEDPPAAPASALSALNSSLGDKAPPSFVPFSLTSCCNPNTWRSSRNTQCVDSHTSKALSSTIVT